MSRGREARRVAMRHLVRRLLGLLPVLLLISGLAFVLVRLAPGGPFDRDRAPASPEIERALRERYRLEDPLWRQYLAFLGGYLTGDLGPSLKYRNHTVVEILAQGLPVSLGLGGVTCVFALGTGLALGMAGAVWRNRTGDWIANLTALVAVCVPGFVIGPLLMYGLAVRWEMLPVALWGGGWHLVLPVLTLGGYYAGRVARLVREGLTEALQADYIRAARAQGVSETRVLLVHALPVAILPVVTYSGPMLADLLTGSFVVENLFQLPGIGTLTVNSALNRDYPLIVALVMVYASLLLILNLVVDLVQVWLDPRLRHDG